MKFVGPYLSESMLSRRDEYFTMPISKDVFIHFTLEKWANEIVMSKTLKLNPSHGEGIGPNYVYAVSATFGDLVHKVQTSHVLKWGRKHSSKVVAIKFRTTTKTDKLAYVEEVMWNKDVKLINPKVISITDAFKILRNTPETLDDTKGEYVKYD